MKPISGRGAAPGRHILLNCPKQAVSYFQNQSVARAMTHVTEKALNRCFSAVIEFASDASFNRASEYYIGLERDCVKSHSPLAEDKPL